MRERSTKMLESFANGSNIRAIYTRKNKTRLT